MKTVIIGANGMLGSMLARVFADQNPICWDKEDIDITNIESVRSRLRIAQPYVIINAAAYTDVDGAETDRDAAFAVNETGIRNLATVAQEMDAVLVQYSTDYVFPGDKKEGYTEDDSPGPAVNVYGESKLAGERALVEIRPKFYLLRTAWLYGPNGKNFVDTMLALAEQYDKVSVVGDQFGCPTYTKDVARATQKLLYEEYPPGIYHTVNSGVASWFDFAQHVFVCRQLGVDVKKTTSDAFPRPAKRPAYSILQNTRGPNMRPWKKALEAYLSA
jgi:dTDP-4-dehydrorhamnose reductase